MFNRNHRTIQGMRRVCHYLSRDIARSFNQLEEDYGQGHFAKHSFIAFYFYFRQRFVYYMDPAFGFKTPVSDKEMVEMYENVLGKISQEGDDRMHLLSTLIEEGLRILVNHGFHFWTNDYFGIDQTQDQIFYLLRDSLQDAAVKSRYKSSYGMYKTQFGFCLNDEIVMSYAIKLENDYPDEKLNLFDLKGFDSI